MSHVARPEGSSWGSSLCRASPAARWWSTRLIRRPMAGSGGGWPTTASDRNTWGATATATPADRPGRTVVRPPAPRQSGETAITVLADLNAGRQRTGGARAGDRGRSGFRTLPRRRRHRAPNTASATGLPHPPVPHRPSSRSPPARRRIKAAGPRQPGCYRALGWCRLGRSARGAEWSTDRRRRALGAIDDGNHDQDDDRRRAEHHRAMAPPVFAPITGAVITASSGSLARLECQLIPRRCHAVWSRPVGSRHVELRST